MFSFPGSLLNSPSRDRHCRQGSLLSSPSRDRHYRQGSLLSSPSKDRHCRQEIESGSHVDVYGLLVNDGAASSAQDDPAATPVVAREHQEVSREQWQPRLPPTNLSSRLDEVAQDDVVESKTTIFTETSLHDFRLLKSRVACVLFETPGLEPSGLVADVVSRINAARARTYGEFGFHVRQTSHFATAGGVCVVLISKWPLTFRKWDKVYHGLAAGHIWICHAVREVPGPMRASLKGVAEAFPQVTSLIELVDNRVEYECEVKPPRPRAPPRNGGDW